MVVADSTAAAAEAAVAVGTEAAAGVAAAAGTEAAVAAGSTAAYCPLDTPFGNHVLEEGLLDGCTRRIKGPLCVTHSGRQNVSILCKFKGAYNVLHSIPVACYRYYSSQT